MKTVKLSELDQLIQKYCDQKEFTKPLMLWFARNQTLYEVKAELTNLTDHRHDTISIIDHPSRGRHRIVPDGEIVKQGSGNVEFLNHDHLPESYSDRTKRIIYHSCGKQLEMGIMEYCVYQLRKLQKPFICLVNDFSAGKEWAIGQDDLEKYFDQYCVLERTYAEWRESKSQGIIPEMVKYLDAHQDLFIESPALAGMPKEAVHTREHDINSLSEIIEDLRTRNESVSSKIKELHAVEQSWGSPLYPNSFHFTDRDDFRELLEKIFA
ncbi:MAG: hypothetical protein J6T80_05405 [Paludibacteraceae bacterium]|nr:hypothetical protein [Paludibacteraceae bacterium]